MRSPGCEPSPLTCLTLSPYAIMLTLDKTQLFGHIVEQHVNDAAFLWLQRSLAVKHAHHTAASIAKLDTRVQKHLNGLMLSPRQAWDCALEAAEFREGGEVFVLAIQALASGDKQKIQVALDIAIDNPDTLKGFISALGWLPKETVYPWLQPWITSSHSIERYLSVSACSVRRLDPQTYLTALLKDNNHLQSITLYARALRLIGELKRRDLAPVLAEAQAHEHPDVVFWACWSSLLLGDRSVLHRLEPYVLNPGPMQTRAIEIAFRCLTPTQAWAWLNQLNNAPDQTFQTALALAHLGDPQGVNWLLARMEEPRYTKVAGDAFCMITGADLEREGLTRHQADLDQPSSEDVDDDEIPALDGYENLPVPDPSRVSQYWQNVRHQFNSSQNYFLGQPLGQPFDPNFLQNTVSHGRQSQRLTLALTHALLDAKAGYTNMKAPLYNAT